MRFSGARPPDRDEVVCPVSGLRYAIRGRRGHRARPAVVTPRAHAAAAARPESWAVVGGGMLGLTLALRLREQGKRVTVFERADRVGGLASAWSIDTPDGPITWDRHYHVTLLSDASLRRVLAQLGLDDADAVGRDEDRVLRGRAALVGLELGRVPSSARPADHLEAAARAHDPARVAREGLGATRAGDGRAVAHAVVRARRRSGGSGCRCCGPSSARAGPTRTPRSSGRRSSASTRRAAAG